MTASTRTFDHVAKLGRERGRESPIAESPAIATLAGRTALCGSVCTVISARAAPTTTPRTTYWTSREPVTPTIGPTTADSTPAKTALAVTIRTNNFPGPGVGRGQCFRPIDLLTCRPPLHNATLPRTEKNGRPMQHRRGDNGDSGRFRVVARLLDSNNEKRPKKVNGQRQWHYEGVERPRVPRPIPIPHPLPEAIHPERLNGWASLSSVLERASTSRPARLGFQRGNLRPISE